MSFLFVIQRALSIETSKSDSEQATYMNHDISKNYPLDKNLTSRLKNVYEYASKLIQEK